MTENLQANAYNRILADILNCTFRPGQLMTEEQLVSCYGVSRTPIRAAIGRLSQEGLVTVTPKKGITVTPVSIDDAFRIFEVRMLYETYAIAEYGNRFETEELLRFYSSFRSLKKEDYGTPGFFALDNDFHQYFIDRIGNPYISRSYSNIKALDRRLRTFTGAVYEERLDSSNSEHIEIARHCLEKDWDLAVKALKEHLAGSKARTFEALLTIQDGNHGF